MRIEDLTRDEVTAYGAVYQAYAWHQGYVGQPVKFRIPDEYFHISPTQPEGFDLEKFMVVVDNEDSEGAIHFWKYEEAPVKWAAEEGEWPRDRFLTLVCTEDDSTDSVDMDTFHRPYHWMS